MGSDVHPTAAWLWELEWREKRRGQFQKWLDGGEESAAEVIKQLELYRSEFLDLRACLLHADNVALIGPLSAVFSVPAGAERAIAHALSPPTDRIFARYSAPS